MTLIRVDHYISSEHKEWLKKREKDIGVKPSETIRRLIDAEIKREEGRKKK
jgi:hypothetical protein